MEVELWSNYDFLIQLWSNLVFHFNADAAPLFPAETVLSHLKLLFVSVHSFNSFYHWVLVFRVLVFRVLVFRVLVFRVLGLRS